MQLTGVKRTRGAAMAAWGRLKREDRRLYLHSHIVIEVPWKLISWRGSTLIDSASDPVSLQI